ncbi:hypothetical protein ACX801_24280 [Arthrobacter bambusae]
MKSSDRNVVPMKINVVPMKIGWIIPSTFGAVLAGTLVAFGRLSPTAQGTIWAEDGAVFLQDALSRRGLLDVFAPYQGYLHVVPRAMTKFVVRFFSIDDFAIAVSSLSCLLITLIALMVFHCSRALTTNVLIRLAWASITIFVAPGALETQGNFANIHWYLLWLVPWLLIKPTQSKYEGVLLFVVAALASLTEILTVMFVPLFLYRFKDKALLPARLGLLVGITCQIITTLSYPRSAPFAPVNVASVAEGWFLNSSSAVIFGTSRQISRNILNFGVLPVVLAALPFFLAFLYLLLKGSMRIRVAALSFVAASVGVWTAAAVFNFSDTFDYSEFGVTQWGAFLLGRYSTVPSMFLLALVPLLAVLWEKTSPKATTGVLAAFLVLQCLYFFPSSAFRQEGPLWATGVATARVACIADPGMTEYPIGTAPGAWKVQVHCNDLRP